MKKWVILVLMMAVLSGCSWKKAVKWFDEMEWERDDRTVTVVDLFIR